MIRYYQQLVLLGCVCLLIIVTERHINITLIEEELGEPILVENDHGGCEDAEGRH